MFENQ